VALQTFTAVVSRVRTLTHDVKELDLDLIEPRAIQFKPGQFVSFQVAKAGVPAPVTRPYSIVSPPSRAGRITLLLNLVPGGPGSTYLFGLREGDRTQFKGPAGSFYLRDDKPRDLLFVATGTGIAPIRSMMAAQSELHSSQAVTLFWGLRSQRDLYYQEEFAVLARSHPRFSFTITLSRPEPGWAGATGRVTALVTDRVPSVANLAAYLCGNGGMIRDVTAVLQGRGLCPIYREKYYDA
jgi:NAD(P)H-flavin reductase